MFRFRILLILSVLIGEAPAQNLVPNGSFEDYLNCPPYFGFASNATGWQNLYTQSADYFNTCHANGVVGVPLNQFGYQYAADSNAYMGVATYAYNQPSYREMVGIQLNEPLQVGEPICLSFKMAVGGFGTSVGNSAGYTCKGVGMKFFMELPTAQYIYDYPNSAALYLDQVPTDTAIWYQVEGTYVPDSAYAYVVVGNFFADSLNEAAVQDSIGFSAADWAYAFIDDVRVSVELEYCTTDLSVAEEARRVPLLYPMPVCDVLNIRMPERMRETVQYVLRDMGGRIVREGVLVHNAQDPSIDTASLSAGMYILSLTTAHHNWASSSVVCVSP
jgi:hypothetical protein